MELGSARPAPAAAPTPCTWTSSSWPPDPGYSWEGPQTVSKHVKYGWMWIMPQWRLLKTIKIFWKVSFIYLVFIISLHPWILQSKINTKLALQYEAMHHWTMLGITILCVTILCAGHCSCPGPGDGGHGHGKGQSVTLKAIIFFSIQKKLLYIRKIFVYTSRNI